MATTKKKSVNVPSGGWPKIVQGTHLTVKTFEDGHTELEWDDEQLLKEVREAIASVKTTKPAVKAKSNKKVPDAMKRKVDDSVLNAYNDERLVSKQDKMQAEKPKKAPAKKTVAKKKTK